MKSATRSVVMLISSPDDAHLCGDKTLPANSAAALTEVFDPVRRRCCR